MFESLQSERFVMRSQLDCRDGRLPGTGIFDVKTRACLPIRLDIFNHEVSGRLIFGYLCLILQGKLWLPHTKPARRSRKLREGVLRSN